MTRQASPLSRNRAGARVEILGVEAATSAKVQQRAQATLLQVPGRAPETWLLCILSTPPEPLGKVQHLQARMSALVQQKAPARSSKVPARGSSTSSSSITGTL